MKKLLIILFIVAIGCNTPKQIESGGWVQVGGIKTDRISIEDLIGNTDQIVYDSIDGTWKDLLDVYYVSHDSVLDDWYRFHSRYKISLDSFFRSGGILRYDTITGYWLNDTAKARLYNIGKKLGKDTAKKFDITIGWQ